MAYIVYQPWSVCEWGLFCLVLVPRTLGFRTERTEIVSERVKWQGFVQVRILFVQWSHKDISW